MLPANPVIPSFDAPIDLLLACHGKARRFALLCGRLSDHTARHGADEAARSAAAAILRYFTVAAPLHHADEEQDLFPSLHGLRDEKLGATLRELEKDHGILDERWERCRPWLEAIQRGVAEAPPAALADFARRYLEHIEREEREVFPHAAMLPEQALQTLGDSMARRRGG